MPVAIKVMDWIMKLRPARMELLHHFLKTQKGAAAPVRTGW